MLSQTTDTDYIRLLAGQLVGQAEASPALAADLSTVEVEPDTPDNVRHAASWARWIHSGAWVPESRDPVPRPGSRKQW